MKNKILIKKELSSKRVFFKNKNIRNQFFSKLKCLFGTWKNLGKKFNIYKSKLERIRNGEVSIKYFIFQCFLSELSIEDKEYFSKNVTLKDKNWGRSKGGISTYKKHKEIFEKGRKIGAKSNRRGRYNFKIDVPLTPELCELIGAYIGDGFSNKYGNVYIIQFTGHSTLDKDYHLNKIKNWINLISQDANPRITTYGNVRRLTVYSKQFYQLLTKRFGFKGGKKAYTVRIPTEILNSNQEFVNSCIRGIFDTDGRIYFDRRSKYVNPYVRIGLKMSSKGLLKEIYSILADQGINVRITKDFKDLQINGLSNCKDFIETIGFSNRRHLDKVNDLPKT